MALILKNPEKRTLKRKIVEGIILGTKHNRLVWMIEDFNTLSTKGEIAGRRKISLKREDIHEGEEQEGQGTMEYRIYFGDKMMVAQSSYPRLGEFGDGMFEGIEYIVECNE